MQFNSAASPVGIIQHTLKGSVHPSLVDVDRWQGTNRLHHDTTHYNSNSNKSNNSSDSSNNDGDSNDYTCYFSNGYLLRSDTIYCAAIIE